MRNLAFLGLILISSLVPVWGQELVDLSIDDLHLASSLEDAASESEFVDFVACEVDQCDTCSGVSCRCSRRFRDRLHGSVETLIVRPHFSEAVAYAAGSQTATTFNIGARPIKFDYRGGIRAMFGLDLARHSDSLRFTYSYLRGDVSISSANLAANEFIVDPFGNVVGSVTIVDPSDARFGTTITGGDAIQTRSTVDVDVYDIDFHRIWGDDRCWEVALDAGIRIANVKQTYHSLVTAGATTAGFGSFFAEFTGAGPHLGLRGTRAVGAKKRLAFYGSTHTALMLGDYDVVSGNNIGGGAFVANQDNNQRRTIATIETELGARWRVGSRLDLAAGWLFHFWNDMGVSGGTFSGLFNGADDSNNMTFDGAFVRAEFRH